MTQQYVAGELSLILARLQTVATDPAFIGDVACLRREAEAGPLTTLPSVAIRALGLADRLCWDSLTQGDVCAFSRQAVVGTELRDFGVCAGLLGDG